MKVTPLDILVIEDNAMNRRLARDVLIHRGHTIREAQSYEEGLEQLELAVADVVLLDIQLGDANGTTLLSEIRARTAWCEVPVVAVTAFAMEGDRERLLKRGFDGYISKPINIREFGPYIESLVSQIWEDAVQKSNVKKILVVDDNQHNRQLVQAYLEAEEFETIAVDSGQAALDRFLIDEPDLVLLDIMMPGMNGYETCRRLRALPRGKDVGVVFLTALDDLGSHKKAIDSGGDDFLTKPVNRDELLMRARSLLWIGHLRVEIERGYNMVRTQRDTLIKFQQQKDELMGFLVHDLKNMLASQIANADYLKRQLNDHPVLREAAEDLHDVGRAMDKLVNNVLELGKNDEGSLLIRRTPVDVSTVLREQSEQSNRSLESEGERKTICVQTEDDLIVNVDQDLFQRLVVNLIDNAAKFTPPQGRVDVKAFRYDDGLMLEVRDRGPGIPLEHRETIFRKYYQLDNSGRGSGMGLAFCRIVVVAHGGTIWAEENEGGGSVFCVHLPDEKP